MVSPLLAVHDFQPKQDEALHATKTVYMHACCDKMFVLECSSSVRIVLFFFFPSGGSPLYKPRHRHPVCLYRSSGQSAWRFCLPTAASPLSRVEIPRIVPGERFRSWRGSVSAISGSLDADKGAKCVAFAKKVCKTPLSFTGRPGRFQKGL